MTFIKKNPTNGSDSLSREKQGLDCLSKYASFCGFNTPKVLDINEQEMTLEKIKARSPSTKDWQEAGRSLAKLHKIEQARFGFGNDNWIGLNRQKNLWSENWAEFFTEYRLKFQIDLIRDSKLKQRYLDIISKSCLLDFLNQHSPCPSLVHGDLWSGNIMFNEMGPWLIDPAVYYGDREVDLAMTKMFGGFSESFYKAYENEFPLPPGAETREVIYNLYHYLNHYNLFGASYLNGVEAGFKLIKNLKTL